MTSEVTYKLLNKLSDLNCLLYHAFLACKSLYILNETEDKRVPLTSVREAQHAGKKSYKTPMPMQVREPLMVTCSLSGLRSELN